MKAAHNTHKAPKDSPNSPSPRAIAAAPRKLVAMLIQPRKVIFSFNTADAMMAVKTGAVAISRLAAPAETVCSPMQSGI